MSRRAESVLAHFIAATLCGAVMIGGLWGYKALIGPCEFISADMIPDKVHPGQTVVIDRHFEVTRPARIEMSRSIETVTQTGDILTVQLPGASVDREPGKYAIQRNLVIPHGIPPGEYKMTTLYKAHEWPFFTTFHKAPDVSFVVLPGEVP